MQHNQKVQWNLRDKGRHGKIAFEIYVMVFETRGLSKVFYELKLPHLM